MSETKKKKKRGKTLDLNAFNAQGNGPRYSPNELPSAPGGLPSGPGGSRRGGYGGDRRGGRRGGYENKSSRADESNQWRRPTGGSRPPPRERGGFNSNRERGGFNSNRDEGGFRDRQPRQQPESKYGDTFSRDNFASKKQSTQIRRTPRDTGGFSSVRNSRPPMDDVKLDRSAFGSGVGRPRPMRNAGMRSGGMRSGGMRSAGGYSRGPLKRGTFDGNGEGFGAHLVADYFKPRDNTTSPSSPGSGRPLQYFGEPKKTSASRFARAAEPEPAPAPAPLPRRDVSRPWGKATAVQKEKTPEEIAAEKAEKSQREKEARARKEKMQAEANEKEKERKLKKEEKAAKAAEEARLKKLEDDISEMLTKGEPRELTMDHIEIVFPGLALTASQAPVLGAAVALTVHQNVLDLANAVHILPETCFEEALISMLATLYKRMGELNFLEAIKRQEVDVLSMVSNEESLEKAGLTCLLSGDEAQQQLDDAFAKSVDLAALNGIVRGIGSFPADGYPRVAKYIFDQFFEHHADNPDAWFTNGDVFEFLETYYQGHVPIIDIAIKSWFDNGQDGNVLLTPFDCLLKKGFIYPDQMALWQSDMQACDEAMTAMYCQIDDDRTFSDWLFGVEEEYYDPEAEYEDEEDDGW